MPFDTIQYIQINKHRRETLIRAIIQYFHNQERIKVVLVFGSFLKRDLIRDIDVAIYAVPPLSFEELLWEGTHLEIAVGSPIDLVQVQDVSPGFRTKILQEGQLLIPTRRNGFYYQLLAASVSQLQDLQIETKRVKDQC